ncbi:MAG: hypothetical protein RI955_1432 [Bacteroidota bacterium]
MPQNKHALIRYRIIDERLRNKQLPSPTLQNLVELCSEKLGKKISSSTLQKDLEAMRTDEALGYRAPIEYNHFRKAYQYSDENYSIEKNPLTDDETFSIELAVQILQQFRELPAMKNLEKPLQKMMTSLSIENNQHSFIQLDKPRKYAGSKWLQPLTENIKNKKAIEMSYQSFQKQHSSTYVLEPLLLKEYQHRWYLIANTIDKESNYILTFGLDRITDIKSSNKIFKAAQFNADEYYKNTFGITSLDEPTEKVQLQFSPAEAPYIKSAPWHDSQKKISETKNGCVFEFNLVVSHELKMKILSYGSNVKILKPKHLKDSIKNEIEQMKKNYL